MAFAALLYERKGPLAIVTLNREEAWNALNPTIRIELAEAFDEAQRDPDVAVMIITGKGTKAFCAGADLKHPDTDHSVGELEQYLATGAKLGRWLSLLMSFPKPTIGAVNGLAAGSGMQLAAHCDILIGSTNAQFWMAQVNLGLGTSSTLVARLVRIMGLYRATELAMTGRRMSAEEALAAGLLVKLTSPAELMPAAEEMAATIASQPPLALRVLKEGLTHGLDMPLAHAQLLDRYRNFAMFQTRDRRARHEQFKERKRS
jgi:enoyl-CoA hydratase